jgi:hypothetical protein
MRLVMLLDRGRIPVERRNDELAVGAQNVDRTAERARYIAPVELIEDRRLYSFTERAPNVRALFHGAIRHPGIMGQDGTGRNSSLERTRMDGPF